MALASYKLSHIGAKRFGPARLMAERHSATLRSQPNTYLRWQANREMSLEMGPASHDDIAKLSDDDSISAKVLPSPVYRDLRVPQLTSLLL